MSDDVDLMKTHLRRAALDRRAAQANKDELSQAIIARVMMLPEFAAAATVLWYLHVRSEVRTREALPHLLASKRVAIPYCEANELRLFQLNALDEVAAGAYGILEPTAALRGDPAKSIAAAAVDLAVIPGVAFDRNGTRLGHGAGYYDKLLAQLRPAVPRIALAFECQLFDEIPSCPHDVPMTAIVTEAGFYRTLAGASGS